MRYYFNVQDGATLLDDEGLEFTDINEVRTEALQSAVDFIKDIRGGNFWSGEPWRLWVTDQPEGGGNTLLTLIFSARLAA